MKTKEWGPYQLDGLDKMDAKRWFALFAEQGTGKTWMFLADIERCYRADKIDAVVVMAPNGVHTNWVLREIPKHLGIPVRAEAWSASPTKRRWAELERLLRPDPILRIFTMNYEALNGENARKYLLRFLQSGRVMMILDESQKIKNPNAAVTKRICGERGGRGFAAHTIARRIGSGTPMDKPFDMYSQFDFLQPGLLGTTSFRAFAAEYSQLANAQNPTTQSDFQFRAQVAKNPRAAFSIQVARSDVTGQPIYRNLDRLHSKVAEHSFRVTKDVLGLPPKRHDTLWFDLTPTQRRAYDLMENELRIQLETGELTPVSKLGALIKLQQITSGYVAVPGREELMYLEGKNPRLELIVDYCSDVMQGSVIIWCRFREELRHLALALQAAGRKVVQYHGDVSTKDRETAIDHFQSGVADTFIGVEQAGGTGLTLTAAETTIYCSNQYSSIVRAQSEDRNHRIGTTGSVLYLDVVARDTLDESITLSHQEKFDVAATILDGRGLDLRGIL